MTKPLPIRACCLLDTFLSGRATIRMKRLKLQGTDPSLTSFFFCWTRSVLEELHGAPPRFHTAVRAGFLGLESFHGNWLRVSALSLDRPPSSPDLTPLEFFSGYIKDAVYLDFRSPLRQNLLGGYEMLRLQLHSPSEHTNVWSELEYTQFTCRATGSALTENL